MTGSGARRVVWILTYLACILLLIWPALYNGYPILYSDTASYVASGMKLDTPVDRPITYGLFIRITSIGGFTLWTTIACQAALMVRLIELLLARVRRTNAHRSLVLLVTIAFLALFTSLPWVVAQVMADIFTPMLVLCAILLFLPTDRPPRRYQRVLLHVLFFVCVAAHLSHPLFVVILVLFLFILRFALHRWAKVRFATRPLWGMLGLALLSYPVMSSALAKSGNIFLMGAMAEHGVAKAYLDAHCAENDFKLCAWKDRFPEKAYRFIWDADAPVSAYANWAEANYEFGKIIKCTLTDRRFIRLHISASLKATLTQLELFAIGDGWGPFHDGSDVFNILGRHMRHDMPAMTASKQHQARMEWVQSFVLVHAWALRISLLAVIPLLIVAVRKRSTAILPIALIILLAVMLNAWGSGTFSGEIDRYGCKMIWMLPLLALLALAAMLPQRPAGNP